MVEEPQSYKQALARPDASLWVAAMEDELQSLKRNRTWEKVTIDELPAGKESLRALGFKWVYKKKHESDGSIRYKARLVAKGYEQRYGIDYTETFAPVVNFRTVRTLLALAAYLDLEVHHLDVKTAFLNADLPEDVQVYMRIPEGFDDADPKRHALRLRKSLYGLKQAPRLWNKELSRFLCDELGFELKATYADYSLYVSKDIVIAVYVDDLMLLTRGIEAMKKAKQILLQRYQMTDLGEITRFIGIDIVRNRERRTIHLNQRRYCTEALQKFGLETCKLRDTPMMANDPPSDSDEVESTSEDQLLYQSMLGQIMYAMMGTRPDLAFTLGKLGRFSKNPQARHWDAMIHVYGYLRATQSYELTYDGNDDRAHFHGYTDADYAGDIVTRRSFRSLCL